MTARLVAQTTSPPKLSRENVIFLEQMSFSASTCRHPRPCLIDFSHNCARDPEKNRANASVGQITDYGVNNESPVFSYGDTRDGVLVDLVFQAAVALAFPYFSWGWPICLGSRGHRFNRSVCLWAEIFAFFVGDSRDAKLVCMCAAVHSSFDTEKKKLQLSKNRGVHFFPLLPWAYHSQSIHKHNTQIKQEDR